MNHLFVKNLIENPIRSSFAIVAAPMGLALTGAGIFFLIRLIAGGAIPAIPGVGISPHQLTFYCTVATFGGAGIITLFEGALLRSLLQKAKYGKYPKKTNYDFGKGNKKVKKPHVEYIDRQTGEKKVEKVYFEKVLRFLYGPFGHLLKHLVKYPTFSSYFGWWQRQSISRRKIVPFINKYDINFSEFEKSVDQFTSFNDFFTRKLNSDARPISTEDIIAPAEGRCLYYQDIEKCEGFFVKGKKFSLEKLVGPNQELADKYKNGAMAIFRLNPTDYHRFHFPCDCTPSIKTLINGPLYSVNPIALRKRIEILTENKRMYTTLKTQKYGDILYMIIGATNVGSINLTYSPNETYYKGNEMGYFSFGGSCIILLFEPNKIKFAQDLINHSSEHTETLCLLGQPLEKELEKEI